MTGQENERSAPLYLYEKGERSMNYDPELAALLSQPWSEGACRGYVISAMERCGFKPTDIEQVMLELHEVFDYTTPEGGCGLLRAEPLLTSGQSVQRSHHQAASALCGCWPFPLSIPF
mgnify:CR=1 FL=1